MMARCKSYAKARTPLGYSLLNSCRGATCMATVALLLLPWPLSLRLSATMACFGHE